MQPNLTLTFTDSSGQPRQAAVAVPRFSIGRSPDNDLAISDSNLSRRHALIETFNGFSQISDCGSSNRTTLNGRPVGAPAQLNDGDVITLGNSCTLTVALRPAANFADTFAGGYEGGAGAYGAPAPQAPASKQSWG
ncbi:MAG: FHA domain-containing protein, partial [Pyrinomonadaceae bacterium]